MLAASCVPDSSSSNWFPDTCRIEACTFVEPDWELICATTSCSDMLGVTVTEALLPPARTDRERAAVAQSCGLVRDGGAHHFLGLGQLLDGQGVVAGRRTVIQRHAEHRIGGGSS